MGGEQHLAVGAHGLFDLGGVAVAEQAVGVEVLVDRAERGVGLRRPPRPRHAAGRVDHDPRRLDQPVADERGEGEGGGGHVAAGGGDQRRSLVIGPVQLGQPVDELAQQLGAVVLLAVPGGVQRRVLEAEVGGQVDQPLHPAPELGDEALGRPVGQAQEDQVEAGRRLDVDRLEAKPGVGGGQAGIQLGDRGTGLGVARGQHDLEIGVLGAEAEQFGPGEPGGADDADGEHRATLYVEVHRYARPFRACEPTAAYAAGPWLILPPTLRAIVQPLVGPTTPPGRRWPSCTTAT